MALPLAKLPWAPMPQTEQPPISEIATLRSLEGSPNLAPQLPRAMATDSMPPSVFAPQEPPLPLQKVQASGPSAFSPLDAVEKPLQQKLQKFQDQDARPYGFQGAPPSPEHPNGLAPNHPGTAGEIAHVLSVAGNIAGNIFAPRTMALIPGTNLYREREEGALNSDIGGIEAEKSRNTEEGAQSGAANVRAANDTAEEPARLQLLGAQAAQEQARADALRAGKAWKVETSPGGEVLGVTNGVTNYIPGQRGIPPEAQAILGQALQNEQGYINRQQKPLSAEQADALNQTWNAVAGQYHLPQNQFRAGMPSADAAQLASSFNNVVGRNQGAQSITIKQGAAGNADNARSDRNYQYNSTQLNKLAAPVEQIMQRFGNLESDVAQGTPQADALVAPQLLTVMAGGQGSGLRMNEAEISRIVGGRSAWENLRAAAQHWSTDPKSANSITPAQRQQIHALMGAVKQKLVAKEQIIDQANEQLLDTDDVQQQRRIVADARKQLDAIDSGRAGGGNFPPQSIISSMKEGQYVHGTDGSSYQKKDGKLVPVRAQ